MIVRYYRYYVICHIFRLWNSNKTEFFFSSQELSWNKGHAFPGKEMHKVWNITSVSVYQQVLNSGNKQLNTEQVMQTLIIWIGIWCVVGQDTLSIKLIKLTRQKFLKRRRDFRLLKGSHHHSISLFSSVRRSFHHPYRAHQYCWCRFITLLHLWFPFRKITIEFVQ